jgi:hypothetical protein
MRNRLFSISWVSRILLKINTFVALSGKSCFNNYSGFNETKCSKQKYSPDILFLRRILEFFLNCISSFTVHAISHFEFFNKNYPADNYFFVIMGYKLDNPDLVEYSLNKPEFNSYYQGILKIKTRKTFFEAVLFQ